MGQGVASGVADSKAAVEKAARDVTKARDKEADAAGKVRVAEQQLQALRERGVTDAGRLAAAEERTATARRRSESATRDTQRATNDLSEAQRRAATSASQSGDAAEDSGRRARFSGEGFRAAATGIAAVGAAAVAAVKGLYAIGSQFDDVGDALRISTGKSGAALDALTQSARNVAQVTPAMEGGLAQVGETMADLSQRLGLTGKPLETITSQMIQLKNMGQEVDLQNVTGALAGFGLKGADASKALDELFRVSQSTGVTVNDLAQSAIKGGPALRQFGYGVGDSAALIGVLDRSGLDADKTLAGMTKSLSAFAKEGKNPKEALNETITSIDSFIKKGDQVGAINMASKLFGTRGAAQFVDAVKSGSLSVEGLKAATAGTGDTILGVASDTADFAESWQQFKQRALLTVEPIATRVFGILSRGMGWIADHGVPALQSLANVVGPVLGGAFNSIVGFVGRFGTAFKVLAGVIAAIALPAFIAWVAQTSIAAARSAIMTVRLTAWVIAQKALAVAQRSGAVVQGVLTAAQRAFTTAQNAATAGTIRQRVATVASTVASKVARGAVLAWAAVQWVLNAALNANPIGLIVIAIAALVGGIILAYKHSETFRNIVQAAWNGIKTAVSAVWGWLSTTVFPFFKAALSAIGTAAMWLWNNAIAPAFRGIGAVIDFVWNSIIKPAWDGFKKSLDILGDAFSFLWNNVIKPVWNALGTGIKWVIDNIITPAWEGMKRGINAIKSVFEGVVDGIKTAWEKLKGFVAKPINFVIETVWNNGLLKAWNKVAGFLPGLKQMSPLAPVAFKDGGPVPFGRGATRGKDSVHAVMMPGEHVWDVADVNHAGGQRAMYNMRGMVESGRPFTWTPDGVYAGGGDPDLALGFADGGAVEAGMKLSPNAGEGGLQDIAKLFGRIIKRMWPKGVSSIGGYRPPDGYNEHSTGRALDVMINDAKTGNQVKDFSMANSKNYPVNWTIWDQKMWYPPGRSSPVPDRGSPTQNHMDHDHIFYKEQSVNPNVVPDNLVTSGFGGVSDVDMLNIIKKKTSEIIDKALDPIKQGIGSVVGTPPPEWLSIPSTILDLTKNKALDAVFKFAGGLGDKLESAYNMAKKVTSTVTNLVKSPFKAIGGLFRDQGGFVPTGNSIVTNETGKPEAVLNWNQLNSVKDLMDKGASLSDAITKVGASKPDTETIPDGAVVLKHDSTAADVADAAQKLKDAAAKADPNAGKAKSNVDPNAGQPATGQMKSLKELGSEAGGLLAEGIGDFFDLPSWITDPVSAFKGDDGSNVRTTGGAAAGNGAVTNKPGADGSYSDPKYGDGSTIQQQNTPLTTKMPDTGIAGMPSVAYDPSGGAAQWRPLADWAINYANKTMKGPAQTTAMVEQIGDESGGNPKAVNNSDINAQNGVPSGGLLQVIEPTFQAHRDPRLPNDKFHPGANLVAALRYYAGRYGQDLTTKWGRGKGGYKFGGYTGNLGINDIAGVVHGREFVVDAPGTRKNINLLKMMNSGTDVESALIGGYERWGSVADRAPRQHATASAGGRGDTNITVYGHTAGHIAQEIDRHQWRGSAGYGSRVR